MEEEFERGVAASGSTEPLLSKDVGQDDPPRDEQMSFDAGQPTGFVFFSVSDVDRVGDRWPSTEKIASTNISVLRNLAVVYFNRSDMTKARALLKKIQDSGNGDLDTAMMLIECEFALQSDIETLFTREQEQQNFLRITENLCRLQDFMTKDAKLTLQNVTHWENQLIKKDRLIGIILLHYGLFHYHKSFVTSPEVLRTFAFQCVKNIAHHLAASQENMYHLMKQTIVIILEELLEHFMMESIESTRKQTYVKALCENCIAWCHLSVGDSDEGLVHANRGIKIMEEIYGNERSKRLLYANLLGNRFLALIQQRNYSDAYAATGPAEKAYRDVADHNNIINTETEAGMFISYAMCL